MQTIILVLCVILFFTSSTSAQQEVASFYRGKQIRLVVGGAAGSGYDISARIVGRYIGKHIPGHPTVIVQNQPGAASLVMTAQLYNAAPRDGTVIGASFNGMPTAPLLQPEASRFDPNKLTWIGSANRDQQVAYVWHTAPIQSLEDLTSKELVVGATAPGTSQVDFPLVTKKVLGLQFKVVSGYEGTAQIHRAMEAGEVQGVGATAWSSLKAISADWIATKKIKIIGHWNSVVHPDLQGYPAILSMAKSDADRKGLRLLTSRLDVGRPFFAPPDIPPARAEALRRAFDATMKDPEFLLEATKLKLDVDPMTGEQVAALVADVLTTPAEIVAQVRSALERSEQ